MKQYMDRILELLNSGITKADIARQLISENNLTTNIETMRVYVSRAVAKHGDQGVKEACDDVQVAPSNVPYLWLKTKQASLFIKNPAYRVDEIDYESIILKCIDVKAPSITEIAAMSRLKPASVDSSERIGWQVVESQLAAMLAREISKAGVEVESSAPIQRRQQC